jgi:PAS domain S-box-containing protein
MQSHRIEISLYPEIAEVIRTREPLVITDVRRAPLFDSVREKLKDKPLGSTTLFPVQLDHRVEGVLMLRDRAIRTRGLAEREIRFGKIVTNATAIAIRNARIYETIRDTSERRLSERLKAERRLKQIEKYQRFFDFAGDGLMIVDGSARILFANRAARAILGFDAPAISQITLYDIVEPRGRPLLEELMSSVSEGVHPTNRDLPVVRASGEEAILSLTTSALEESGSGQDVTVIISFRDVTATRRMQEELRRTKDFLLNLIESSADAIVAADLDGKIMIFNQVAERITGYPAAKAIGSSVTMLYPPGVAQEIMADLRSTSYGGVGKLQDRRQSLLTRTGELVPISLAASIVYDEGREIATVGIFSDLRERLRIEETLQKAQRQLELSERQAAVVELAGAAAHELNQPLTSIFGSAELMARKIKEDSPVAGSVKTILAEAERMAEMVRKLGQITRYETKPYVGVTKIVDLDASSEDRGDR